MPLHFAIANSHVSTQDILLSFGASVTAVTGDGWSPIHLCITNAPVKRLEKFLSQPNVDINLRSPMGTPLYLAMKEMKKSHTRLLLSLGAKLYPKNLMDGEWSLLHTTAEENDTELLELFADTDISLDIKDHQGITPLHVAVLNSSEDALRMLLDKGADPLIPNSFMWTPLHTVTEQKYPKAENSMTFLFDDSSQC